MLGDRVTHSLRVYVLYLSKINDDDDRRGGGGSGIFSFLFLINNMWSICTRSNAGCCSGYLPWRGTNLPQVQAKIDELPLPLQCIADNRMGKSKYCNQVSSSNATGSIVGEHIALICILGKIHNCCKWTAQLFI